MNMGSGCVTNKVSPKKQRLSENLIKIQKLNIFDKATLVDELLTIASVSNLNQDILTIIQSARKKAQPQIQLNFYDFSNAAREENLQKHKIIDILEKDIQDNKENYPLEFKTSVNLQTYSITLYDLNNRQLPRQELKNLDFEPYLYTRSELVEYCVIIFQDTGLINYFDLKTEKLRKLIIEIAKRYKKVPYHNFTHAFSLLQMAYSILQASKTTANGCIFTQSEELALYLAALGHDIGHNGLNNLYCNVTKNLQAQVYNDMSTLQNYHAYMTSFLIDESGLLDHFETKALMKIRSNIIACIMGTDMTKHFDITAKLKKMVQDKQLENNKQVKLRCFNQFNLQFLMSAFLHAVDIGNPGLKPQIGAKWGQRITQQFQNQFQEQAIDAPQNPAPPFLKYPGKKQYTAGQSKFAQAMVLPLWIQIAAIFPEKGKQVIENMKRV